MPRYLAGDLLNRVYSRLDNNSQLYPTVEVYAALTEARRVLNLFTGIEQSTASAGNTQANRVFYSVPASIVIPLAVSFGNRQLGRCSAEAMALQHRDWMRHTSANFGAVAHWVPIGIREFAIHPADATGGTALNVTGITEVSAFTLATDAVNIPEEFCDALVELAGHALQLKEGGAVFAAASLLYQKFLHRMKEWERWRGTKHPRYWVESKVPKAG